MSEKYHENRCKVCTHPDRDTIDKLLIEGVKTNRDIARAYGLNESGLSQHRRKHLIGNVKEKLRQVVKDAIMEGIKPENTSDLVKLMTYLEQMENDEFATGKKEWEAEVKGRMEKFRDTIMNPLILDDIDNKEEIIRIAEICFIKENTTIDDLLRAIIG